MKCCVNLEDGQERSKAIPNRAIILLLIVVEGKRRDFQNKVDIERKGGARRWMGLLFVAMGLFRS